MKFGIFYEHQLPRPWGEKSELNRDIEEAQTILDDDHYALEKVKERITSPPKT